MQKIIYVGIGGFIGTAIRYLISMKSSKMFNSNIPLGPLIKCTWGISHWCDNGIKHIYRVHISQFKIIFNE